MSRRKSGDQEPEPSHLKFVGRSDYFVSGVPQSNVKVVDEPQAADEVSAGKAEELVATGLYEPMTAEAYEAAAAAATENTEEAAEAAEEEAANG